MPSQIKRAILRETASGGAYVQWPYHPDLLDDFRELIPREHRSWDPTRQHWYVHANYVPVVKDLFHAYFGGEWEHIYYGMADRNARTDTYHAMLYVHDDAPIEVAEAAWKALAKLYHPDMAGSHDDMLRINLAIERIRKGET